MDDEKPKSNRAKSAAAREDRLKAALKQNMARRKAQSRVRASARGKEQTADQMADHEEKTKTNNE